MRNKIYEYYLIYYIWVNVALDYYCHQYKIVFETFISTFIKRPDVMGTGKWKWVIFWEVCILEIKTLFTDMGRYYGDRVQK